ncbi:hypothetical protein SERLA73DRAFT_149084 [Serpula lacrymans var. lacrymans S7.3]|uniref:Uncharacterized protein n=1 Tax=Serpula lacrymans var. lacrymans (strain S7.3) TaxID=936435 RepID=F8PEZ4_SERL3|nr:hypothetical protein SERLA73DRAFT_149084 [Serpula lacrymans var. lacrymans S7.3]
MHALDLGLLQHHCRTLFQIDTTSNGGDGSTQNYHPAKEKRVTTDREKPLDDLMSMTRRVLYSICVDLTILGPGHKLIVGTKWILVQNICLWRHPPNFTDARRKALQEAVKIYNVSYRGSQADKEESDSVVEDDLSDTGISKDFVDESDDAGSIDMENIGHEDVKEDVWPPPKENRPKQSKHSLPTYQVSSIGSLVNESDDHKNTLCSYVHVSSPRHALGKDVMAAVWEDMESTILPSWISCAPPDWGTTTRGKLKANNWHTICTIHLPITLIRLWCNNIGRRRDMLQNFMDLVSAVRIANVQVTSRSQIQAYNKHIFCYVDGIKRLYPDQRLRPNHHAALHMGDMMDLFGPVYSHKAPFYERYIHVLQRLNTNKKFGEIEQTFMETMSRSSIIRATLADNPESTGITDSYTTRQVVSLDQLSIRGVRYGTEKSRAWHDSHVIFLAQRIEEVQWAGTIQTIFRLDVPLLQPEQSEHNKFYATVLEYGLVEPSYICDARPIRQHVIKLPQIICHFAKMPMEVGGQDFIHVLPLDRHWYTVQGKYNYRGNNGSHEIWEDGWMVTVITQLGEEWMNLPLQSKCAGTSFVALDDREPIRYHTK